jgi:antitoxin component of MazEF toxin-antitoxin module
MSIRLCKWGNSTGLRIPAALLSSAGLKEGRYVSLRVLDNGEIRVRPVGQVVPAETDGGSNPPAASPKEEVW